MDGRGRLAQPLKRSDNARARAGRAPRLRIRSTPLGRLLHDCAAPLLAWRPPRGLGAVAAVAIVLGAGGYGAVRGDHLADLSGGWHDLCDGAANAFGFRIAEVALSGDHELSRGEVFAAAGLSAHSSLPFFDLGAARARLEAVPWIAQATLRKFYPGRLEIEIKERAAFALWQHDGKVWVIAADGAPLQAYDSIRFNRLPVVVGAGAATRARDFLAMLGDYPTLAGNLRAAVLVAQRRWNLRLTNGIEVKLPETGVDAALATLVKLDGERSLMSRDIAVIDLRLPDRVSVQLSDAAAAARAEAWKDKGRKAKKGGDA